MSIPESALNYGSILTLLGENAEVNGKLNNKSITFTHIAIGDGNDQYVQPSRTQTTLVNEITRIPVTGMEKIEPSEEGGIPQLKVWAKIPDNIVDVAVREFAAIAVYDGNSYLHAVGNSVRIPILSGVNNGGEVNDIYIEMTFAVTSLDPIIMIDPTIVTATRKYVDDKDKAHTDAPDPHAQYPLATKAQGLEYDPDRTYYCGDTCYTRVADRTYQWEAYSLEPFSGKDPNDPLNRRTGWTDVTKPFYWKARSSKVSGETMAWDNDAIPENMVLAIGQQLPVAVYHSLAAAKPEWIDETDNTLINIPDRQGRFVRAADGTDWLAGETHEDAIRSITGYLVDISGGVSSGSSGVFSNTFLGGVTAGTGSSTLYQNTYSFDVSRQVPVAPEVQPKAFIEWVGYAL
ncbi:phage tail protein [Vibrio diazotrophicus]|uniref:phage tail-collar fiber domain-containing protein n=1 Tax=Vibrio diazotrophicus TaxID=685 RepID=UPI0022AF1475|nr:phage tail protein [Vibrio diazotrophicus]MCZ4371414.1 phage tail protein [Vibrio diazotrophicus]